MIKQVKFKPTDAILTVIHKNNAPERLQYLIVRYGSEQDRDLDREFFDKNTYFMRQAGYPIKGAPLTYQHGMKMDSWGAFGYGVIDLVDEHQDGLLVEAELNDLKRYVDILDELKQARGIKANHHKIVERAEAMKARFEKLLARVPLRSSGGFDPATWRVSDDGHIQQAGVIHSTLTPTPSDFNNPVVQDFQVARKSLLNLDDLHERQTFIFSESTTDDKATGDASGANAPEAHEGSVKTVDSNSNTHNQLEDINMDEQNTTPVEPVVATKADIDALNARLDELASGLESNFGFSSEIAKKAVSEAIADANIDKNVASVVQNAYDRATQAQKAFEAEAERAFDALKAQAPAVDQPMPRGNHGAKSFANVSISDKYQNWSAEDYIYASMIDAQIRAKGKQPILGNGDERERFMREFASKAERRTDLPSSAMSAVKAIKANELNHSTQSSYGDEWVPDSWSQMLWRKARMDTVVAQQFRIVEMPTNPFELPTEGTDPSMYYVPETTAENQLTLNDGNSPIPDSKIGSGKVQMSAKKFAIRVGFSAELEEDSIIPVIPMYREQAMTAFNEQIDDVLLNGDTETGTTNINQDGSALGGTSRYLALDGLRKNTFDNTSNQTNAGATPTLAMIRALRFKLARQVSTKLAGLRIFTNPETYAKLLSLDEFLTYDKVGAMATNLTGQVGIIDGMPVLVTDQLQLADTDGKVSNGGNGTDTGALLVAYAPHWYIGYRRRLAVDLSYIPYYDSYQLTMTARMDFVGRDNDSVGLLFNVTV